jgi:flagellar biosynthetic protein FliQ
LQIVREGVLETLIVAGPILLVGMAVGLIVAILQATTSIQEQTLTFVPKIAAILIALVIFGRFLLDSLVGYTMRIFQMISKI